MMKPIAWMGIGVAGALGGLAIWHNTSPEEVEPVPSDQLPVVAARSASPVSKTLSSVQAAPAGERTASDSGPRRRLDDTNSVRMLDPAPREASGTPTPSEVDELMNAGDVPGQLLALELVDQYEVANAADVIKSALTSTSPQVRATAIELAGEMQLDDAPALATSAVTDRDPFVGYAALQVTESLDRDDQQAVYRSALQGAAPEVGSAVVGILETQSNHASVDLMIDALSSPVTATKQEAQIALEFLFEHSFDSSDQARTWWQHNAAHYDRNLGEK